MTLVAISREFDPIESSRIRSLVAMFKGDQERFQKGESNADWLAPSIGYVLGYPAFRQAIGSNWCEDEAGTRWHAFEALDHVHMAAVNYLMKEAERHGIDSGSLWEFGRLCRKLFEDGGAKYSVGGFSAWPDCLGSSRSTLSTRDQDTVLDGEVVLRRLNARLQIPLDDPVRVAWTTLGQQPSAAQVSTAAEKENGVLDAMRYAIASTPDGKTATTKLLIRTARVKRQDGLNALRNLEESGEYKGFTRRRK